MAEWYRNDAVDWPFFLTAPSASVQSVIGLLLLPSPTELSGAPALPLESDGADVRCLSSINANPFALSCGSNEVGFSPSDLVVFCSVAERSSSMGGGQKALDFRTDLTRLPCNELFRLLWHRPIDYRRVCAPSAPAILQQQENTTKDTKSTKVSEDISFDAVFSLVTLKLISRPVLMPASFM